MLAIVGKVDFLTVEVKKTRNGVLTPPVGQVHHRTQIVSLYFFFGKTLIFNGNGNDFSFGLSNGVITTRKNIFKKSFNRRCFDTHIFFLFVTLILRVDRNVNICRLRHLFCLIQVTVPTILSRQSKLPVVLESVLRLFDRLFVNRKFSSSFD